MVDEQADVIVVGAGMSGLCASVAALERGARVITVEKGTRFGGSMALSGGTMWTYTHEDLLQEHIPNGNKLLQSVVVDTLSQAHDWLGRHGVAMDPEQDTDQDNAVVHVNRGKGRDGAAHGRGEKLVAKGRGRNADPSAMTTTLVDRVRTLGGQLLLETALDGLLYEGGAVRGVRVFGPDGQTAMEAEAVVVATGGFQGNSELVMRYITPNVSNMYLRSNPWSTGDGFLAATEVGAAVSPGLDCFYGHAIAAPPAVFSPNEFLDVSQKYGPITVALNLDGSRFTDESAGSGEEVLNQAVARQRDATAFYILDAELMEMTPPQGAAPRLTIERVHSHGGTVIQGDTLEDLCRQLTEHGVHGTRALSTLQEFNAAILEERAEELFPERRKSRFPLVRPPFTAIPVRAGITFSNGGLEVDTEMRVLRRSATISTLPNVIAKHSELKFDVIPGLFAAGCDVGNINHGGYMGGLAPALVTGRIAGRSAADFALAALDAGAG